MLRTRVKAKRRQLQKRSFCWRQNEAGYLSLMKLNSYAYLEAGDALPHVTLDQLAAHSDGLICLSGGALGPVGQLLQDGQTVKARALVQHLAGIYPDRFYIELATPS